MELSSIIPVDTSRKLDKLTVLRMAVQHMKMLRGSLNSYTEGHYKPSFLSDDELKNLILQVMLSFLQLAWKPVPCSYMKPLFYFFYGVYNCHEN